MKNIEELRGKMLDTIDMAKGMIATANQEERSMTTEEKQKHDAYMAEIRSLEQEIEEETRLQNADAETVRAKHTPKTGTGMSYRSLFYPREAQPSLSRGGFENVGEFLQVVNSERFDPRLAELRFQQGGVGALGGFSVPEEFGAWFLDSSIEDEIIRPRANVHPMQSNVKHVPAWDSLDQTGGALYGGIQGQWLAELEQMNEQTAQIRSMTLNAQKLGILCNISGELLQDGQDFVNNLGRAIVRAIGDSLDRAFINGLGAGQPSGILNNPALLTVNRTGFPSGAPGDNYADLVNMYNRLHKDGPGRAVWLVHPDNMPELQTMTDAVGNLIFQANATSSMPSNIFGLPVIPTTKVAAAGQPGDIVLCNLQHYMVGIRKEITLDRSNAPGFTRDFESFRAILRADGQGSWDKPLTRQDGTEVSWSVALQ